MPYLSAKLPQYAPQNTSARAFQHFCKPAVHQKRRLASCVLPGKFKSINTLSTAFAFIHQKLPPGNLPAVKTKKGRLSSFETPLFNIWLVEIFLSTYSCPFGKL